MASRPTALPRARRTPILCGVNGSRPGHEAARQAAVLTEDDAALTYVAIS